MGWNFTKGESTKESSLFTSTGLEGTGTWTIEIPESKRYERQKKYLADNPKPIKKYTVEPVSNFKLSDMALFKDPNKGYVTPAGNKSLSDTVPVQMGPGEAPYLDPFNPVRQSDLLATQKANEEKAKAREYKATHSLSEMLRETPKVVSDEASSLKGYQDLIDEMYTKKGTLTEDDVKRIKAAKNEVYKMVRNPALLSDADNQIVAQVYKALDQIPLSGAGNRVGAGIANMSNSAIGAVDTATHVVYRTGKKLASNNQNPEYIKLTQENQKLYEQMKMAAGMDEELYMQLKSQYDKNEARRKEIDKQSMEKAGGSYESPAYEDADKYAQNVVYGIENEAVKFAIETALSTANFGANFLATGGNAPLTLALMGTQAGARAAHDAAKEGADLNQQLLAGIVGGGIEVLTEKLPIDEITEAWKTTGKNGLQRALKAFVKGGIPEAGEEFVGEIAGDIANSLIMGKPEQMQDPEFWTDTIKTAVRNAASGFVSGGTIAAVPAALSGNAAQTDPQPQTQEAPSPSVQNNQVPQVDPVEYSSYIDQVSKSVKGELPPQDLITIGSTPDILLQHGAQQRTLTMNQNTVQKIAYPEGYMGGKHNLGFAALEQLPIQLQNPVAILKSDTQPNSLVVFTELLDTNNRPVMEAIHLDKKGSIGILNQVASMYSKDGFENFIATQEKRGNVLYTDPSRDLASLPETGKPLASMTPSIDPMLKKENQQPLPGEGLQLSKLEAATGSSINSIPQSIADGDIKNGTGGHSPREGLQSPKLAVTTDSSTNSIYQSNENSNMFSELTQRLMAEKRAKENALKNGPEGFEFTSPKSTGIQTESSANGKVVDLQAKKATSKVLDQLVQKYGRLKPGSNPAREVMVPKKTGENQNVRRFYQSTMEAEVTPEEMVGTLAKDIASGKASYTPISDKGAQLKADNIIERYGLDGALSKWEAVINGDKRASKDDIVLAEKLYMEAVHSGDFELAEKLVSELSIEATLAGQEVQAFQLIDKMTPEGRYYYVKKGVDRYQSILDKSRGYKAPTLNIDVETPGVKELLSAKNQAQIIEAEDMIIAEVAKQIDPTGVEKWNEWRYLSMLLNPLTHLRNIGGNYSMSVVRKLKNLVGSALELTIPKEERSKAILTKKDRNLIDFAKNDFEAMKPFMDGSEQGGLVGKIKEHRQIFKTKWLEKVRKLSKNLLESEDFYFMKNAYADSLAQFMKTRGYTIDFLTSGTQSANKALQDARSYAIDESLKATFHDMNEVAAIINNFKNSGKIRQIVGGGLFPFTKTPLNIVKRASEYSIFNVANVISDFRKAAKGEIPMHKVLNDIASTLSGTAITALGILLGKMGIIKASAPDDKKERDFEKLTGEQHYSINFGPYSMTIDWLSPGVIPLLLGAEIASYDFGDVSPKNLYDSAIKLTAPIFETTMLQGLNMALSAPNSDSATIDAIISSVQSYFGQAIPTIISKAAKTIDPVRRNTYYYDENSPLPRSVDSFVKQTAAKIPFLSMTLEPFVDQWGREQREDDVIQRFINNFINPGYVTKKSDSPVDAEIKRLYDATGKKEVLPSYAPGDFKVNGEDYHPSSKEATKLAKEKGQASYGIIEKLTETSAYRNLTDTEKSSVIADVYTYALNKAKQSVNPAYIPEKWITNAQLAEKKGIPLEQYILYKNAIADMGADKDSKGKAIAGSKKSKVLAYIKSMPITTAQKNYLIGLAGYKTE